MTSVDQDCLTGGDADEPYVPFRDVPKLPCMPPRRRGSKLAVETVHRWATAGVRGHVLPFSCVGGVRCTKKSWLLQFFDRIATGTGGVTTGVPGPLTDGARRRADAAEREFEREGF